MVVLPANFLCPSDSGRRTTSRLARPAGWNSGPAPLSPVHAHLVHVCACPNRHVVPRSTRHPPGAVVRAPEVSSPGHATGPRRLAERGRASPASRDLGCQGRCGFGLAVTSHGEVAPHLKQRSGPLHPFPRLQSARPPACSARTRPCAVPGGGGQCSLPRAGRKAGEAATRASPPGVARRGQTQAGTGPAVPAGSAPADGDNRARHSRARRRPCCFPEQQREHSVVPPMR